MIELGSEIIAEDMPKLINLAYTMDSTVGNKKFKFNNGYFGWVKYALEADGVEKIKESLKRNEDLIRYLIIKTVRENTLATKKPIVLRDKTKKKEDEIKEDVQPMNSEEVDKKIEELVI